MEQKHIFPEPKGLLVAKGIIREDDPSILEVTYYHDSASTEDDHTPRRLLLKSDGTAIEFPGQFRLSTMGESNRRNFEINMSNNGATGFEITINEAGKLIAKGLGVRDPDDVHSMLVSGWTGETEPYGIAKYTIRDMQSVSGYYLSKMSPDQPGSDTAIGDTSSGFPGNYSLTTAEVSGRTWGPHDWQLAARGDLIDLVWRDKGNIISRGFGIVDPEDQLSIIVNYIAISK